MSATARVLIVAGSDSGGGAGIQADLKTVAMLGGHAMTAITAITAQNTLGVEAVLPIPADMVVQQMRSCLDDIGVDAVKLGMIGSADTAHAVADVLERLDVPIVFDPVMVATSGSVLADADTVAAFARLMGIATLVTPNLPELAVLTGEDVTLEHQGEHAAQWLADTHRIAVLAKGGHRPSERATQVLGEPNGHLLADHLARPGEAIVRWTGPRIETSSTHGTGCTLATAIATGLGQGMELTMAIARARRFVRASLEAAPGLGHGHGPMGQQFVRDFGA